MNNDKICVVPWIHLNFEPDGQVTPCCLTSAHHYYAGDLNKNSVEEIWNSDNMKKLRKEMINGIEPKICDKCFNNERVTGESSRVYRNNEFKKVIEIIPEITQPDGTGTTMDFKYCDFRFSNLCNFKCRSCGPRYSSAWVPDAKKMGYTDQEKVWNIEAVNESANFDFLKEQVHTVERIYFAGGEPLMMPEHWQIMDMLVENNRFDVRISYNTNLSSFSYSGKHAFNYWRQWNHKCLEIWPSIDEIGERAELIRSGTVWNKVDNNLRELLTLDNAIIRPNVTVGAWNVNRLPEIIDYFVDVGVFDFNIDKTNFFSINVIEWPDHYHVQILTDEFKLRTLDKLHNYIESFKQKYNVDLSRSLEYIMSQLHKPHNPYIAMKFINTTEKLDKIRNETLVDVIPEMREIYDLYAGY